MSNKGLDLKRILDILEREKDGCQTTVNNGATGYVCDLLEAYNVALDTIYTYISPSPPKHIQDDEREFLDMYLCPKCGLQVHYRMYMHCPSCGKMLDWGKK